MSNHYNYSPKQIQEIRNELRNKCNYRCYFCNRDIRPSLKYTTHHIVPKRILKERCWEIKYLVCLCKDCHFKIEKFNNMIFKEVEKQKVKRE